MVEQNLGSILSVFEQKGHLHYVDRAVDPRYELGAFLIVCERGPSLFFRNVKGYDIPVVGNLLNTPEKIALALGIEHEQIQEACIGAIQSGIQPEIVSQAAVQEVCLNAPLDILGLLPVPTWFERETGPYITAGIIVAKDPETGCRNVSIARLRVDGGNRLMAGIAPTHHLSHLMRTAHEQGRPLEIAVAIGNHPAILLASQMYVDFNHDEFDIAGRLMGGPVRLVRCRSVDLEVPAEAEIILEGTLHKDESIDEGPISEFHGFYENYGPGHAVHVKTVTHRSEPIYQAVLPGYASEHCLLGGVAIGATTCLALQRVMPAVRQVNITEGGMGRLHAIITLRQAKRGEAKRVIMLAMGTINLLKLVIVVDDDIDPYDWRHVEWAIAARMRGEEDIMIIPGAKADRCDPLEKDLTVTKVGIVATTRPGDGEPDSEFEFARPPKNVLEDVRREFAGILKK